MMVPTSRPTSRLYEFASFLSRGWAKMGRVAVLSDRAPTGMPLAEMGGFIIARA